MPEQNPLFTELRFALAKLSPEKQKAAVRLLQAVLDLVKDVAAAEAEKESKPTK